MKIAICQINPTVGAINENVRLIKKFYNDSLKKGADLVVFPELAISGYPPQDLLLRQKFLQKCDEALNEIINECTIPIVLGNTLLEENELFNCSFLGQDGSIVGCYKKILLPTYDVFDEDRYFEKGNSPKVFPIKVSGEKINLGLQICEDLWDSDYGLNISKELKKMNADIIINISASPFGKDRLLERSNLIKEKIKETSLPFIYCNLVGSQDELIFDGQSLAFNSDGSLVSQGKAFSEDLVIADMVKNEVIEINKYPSEKMIYEALVLGVRDYFHKSGHSHCVIGLSGGIDSSLTASIAVDALGHKNVHGIAMPSKFSSHHSIEDAKQLAENLNIDFRNIPINSIVESYEALLVEVLDKEKIGLAEENIQSRIRGGILMALSNKYGWMVLSTGNKTELAMGYCTLYGDMNGGLSVISDLSKRSVYKLSSWINSQKGDIIPERSLNKPPSAELRPGQIDPFDYDIISPMVSALIDNEISPSQLVLNGSDPKTVNNISKRIRMNEFKRRQAAPGLRVSSKAFGMGRRVPIINKFDELAND